MAFGTVIHMKNNETFITQSMLSSYMAVETKDYLELLLPFISMCLPEKYEEIIELDKIQERLKNEYGLDIPVNVIEKTLIRLCRKKRGAIVKKISNGYAVNDIYNSKEFEDRTEKIKKCIDAVLSKMQKYLNSKKFLSGATYEKMKEYLAIFLDSYNYSVYEEAQSLDTVILEKKSESNYYVAQFILEEYKNDTLEFAYVLEIIKGSLIAKSIYYFMNSENDMSQKRIQGTNFILDTRVLIDALGLNLEQESVATNELLDLIINNGGKLVTFDYYVEELIGIIYRYKMSRELRLALSLNYFIRNRFSSEDTEAYANTIIDRLKDLNIDVIEKPSYEQNVQKQKWHIDYIKLRDTLNQYIDYRTTNDDYYSEALIHDADTIEAIAYQRGSAKKCSAFDCKVIFVTKNIDICKTIYSLYKDERFKKGEINFAITDIDLTSIIWLSTFGNKSDLPKLKLLEHAYSACAPSRTVMNEFLNKVHTLEKSEKISQDMAIMLRSQYATINDLTEISHNKEGSINDATIYEMERRLRNRAEKEVKIQYKKELDEIAQQRQEIEKERQAVDTRREELIVEQRKTSKLKQDTEYIANKLDKKRNIFSDEKKENDKKIEKIKNMQQAIITRAKQQADIKKRVTKVLLYTFIIILAWIIIVLFAIATWKNIDLSNIGLIRSYVYVGIISVICLVMSAYTIVKWLGFRISRIAEKIYDHAYSKYISKNKDLFE